ncbi:hypothetical protein CORC01_11549 [Colletotrichum orchidophilum]|uniref:Uncharacterized protein n=1 Tax=Colletotrichum orchidophilum TaxID=1209926 RepID=A0A1G4AVE4_9PEZI|nr:uncharacterized protein CORC01_11549 [Colletotrichum orchidophilum]OHE93137.1 hypothetical protein CORC01_11549 [Colletotrichum orchidophilum]
MSSTAKLAADLIQTQAQAQAQELGVWARIGTSSTESDNLAVCTL